MGPVQLLSPGLKVGASRGLRRSLLALLKMLLDGCFVRPFSNGRESSSTPEALPCCFALELALMHGSNGGHLPYAWKFRGGATRMPTSNVRRACLRQATAEVLAPRSGPDMLLTLLAIPGRGLHGVGRALMSRWQCSVKRSAACV